MKPIILAALLLATPVLAQEAEPTGLDRALEGAGEVVQGLREEAQPALNDLTQFGGDVAGTVRLLVTEVGPGFFDVFRQVDSLQNYEVPAIQANGDILIRRRADAPEWVPPAE